MKSRDEVRETIRRRRVDKIDVKRGFIVIFSPHRLITKLSSLFFIAV